MDRKKKKGDFRTLWNTRINAGTRADGLSYSRFIAGLKKHSIALDRKMLSELAERHPTIFKKIVDATKA